MAQAMEPLLSSLMDDAFRDTAMPANTAIVPVPKLENDSYDWYADTRQSYAGKMKSNPRSY